VKPGDEIFVVSDEPEDDFSMAGRGRGGNSVKGKKADSKQTTITSMFKAQPAKSVRKNARTVVRLTNAGGFGG